MNEHLATTDRAIDGAGSPAPDTVDGTTPVDAGPPDPPVTEAPDHVPGGRDGAPRDPLSDAVDALTEALTASRRTQEHQQILLDRLHEEKERLREAEQRRQRDPLLRDLILLSDTCLRTSRQWRDRGAAGGETARAVSGALADVAADVTLVLERQGIESFQPVSGDRFTRSEAKAVGVLPTADADRDGLVAEVRKPGYRMGERVLRFSEVVVWRFEPGGPVPGRPPTPPADRDEFTPA